MQTHDLTIRRAGPGDTPQLARLLAAHFQGKYAIALGWEEATRARRMETLLPTGIVCPGFIYVACFGDDLVASFSIKTAENTPTPADYAAARHRLARTDSPLRARWAITVLRNTTGGGLQPDEAYVDNLVVARQWQRQGIATHLAAYFYDEARNLRKDTLLADVMSGNRSVVGLFRQEGWEVTGSNYWVAPIMWPLFGSRGILRVSKRLAEPKHERAD